MQQRLQFTSVFAINQDGSITALVPVKIAGIIINQGTTLYRGNIVGGIDLTQHTQSELGVEVVDGAYVIRAIY